MLQKLRNSKISNGVKKILPILIIIFFLTANFAEAVAVKVRPVEIKIEANAGVLAEKEIIIENPGGDVALFEIYPDDFSEWIKINPESFILESGKSQKVILEIKNEETGIFSTMISVVAKPLSERKFKANSGVKIPLEVRIAQREKLNFLAAISQSIKSFLEPKNLIFIFVVILILTLAGIWIKTKKNVKIIIGLGVFLILVGSLIFLNKIVPFEFREKAEIFQPEAKEEVSLIINYGEGKVDSFQSDFKEGMTAFNLLRNRTGQSGITLKTKSYDIGILVETIGDKENGQDGKYWLYYVNEEMPMVSADKMEIKPGDKVEFKFEKSSF